MNNDNNESSLLRSLHRYLQDKKDDKLELKPNEFKNSKSKKESALASLEKVSKDSMNIMTKENRIICDNILIAFYGLPDEKFTACIQKMNEWGMEICLREFILNYYLYIKKSNKLKQYITLHLDLIISMLKNIIETDLFENMKNFNFETYKMKENVEFLKNDYKNREFILMQAKTKGFDEFEPPSEETKELLDSSQRKTLRMTILNRLKAENELLEEDF